MKKKLELISKYIPNRNIAILTMIAMVSSVLLVGLALCTGAVIDAAYLGNNNKLIIPIMIMLLVTVIYSLFSMLMGHLYAKYSLNAKNYIIRDLHKSILRADYLEVSSKHSVDLLNIITADAEIVANAYIKLIPTIMSILSKIILGVSILMVLNYKITLICIGLGGVLGISLLLIKNKLKIVHKSAMQKAGEAKGYLQETIGYIEVLKCLGMEDIVASNLKNKLSATTVLVQKKADIIAIMNAFVYFLYEIIFLVAVVFGALMIVGESFLLADFVVLIALLTMLREPFKTSSTIVATYSDMLGSYERLSGIYQFRKDKYIATSEFSSVKLEKVSFGYTGRDMQLIDVDMSINRGDVIAITGNSASGKSTLVRLILGVLRPTKGTISIYNNEDKIALDGIWDNISYVPQTNMIFSGTIASNLEINGGVSRAKMDEACKTACIFDEIMKMEQGFDSIILEGGHGLSTGQVQRLAIARALILDKEVLVLDEATSALDDATEERLLNNILQLNKTIVCISHKSAIKKYANKIVLVEENRLYNV